MERKCEREGGRGGKGWEGRRVKEGEGGKEGGGRKRKKRARDRQID